MSGDVNGWTILTERFGRHTRHHVMHDTKTVGRAIKIGSQWEAMTKDGKTPIYKDSGVEITAKRLCDIPMALADAEISINAGRANRARKTPTATNRQTQAARLKEKHSVAFEKLASR